MDPSFLCNQIAVPIETQHERVIWRLAGDARQNKGAVRKRRDGLRGRTVGTHFEVGLLPQDFAACIKAQQPQIAVAVTWATRPTLNEIALSRIYWLVCPPGVGGRTEEAPMTDEIKTIDRFWTTGNTAAWPVRLDSLGQEWIHSRTETA
jgi:hypothetical protein